MEATSNVIALHAFMSGNRERLLALAVSKLQPRAPGRTHEELLDGTPEVFDEIVDALRREAGLPGISPLPGHSDAAARLGRRRHRDRFAIGMVAFSVGSLAEAVGELGASLGFQFTAQDYHVFNQCIDTITAAAIEDFAADQRSEQHHESSKQLGFFAHEIRNALFTARMSYGALKARIPALTSKTGDVLGRSLTRMQHLVNHALVAAQLEGGVRASCKRIKLQSLCHDVVTGALLDRGVTVVAKCEEGLEVDGDERLLTSAVSNLLQNGIKFTRDGGVVTLRSRAVDGRALVEVEDECGGLPAGKADDLMLPFVQAGADRSGIGLGLSIAREAIEAQRGTLTVKDKPGEGCVFSLELPSATGEAACSRS